MDTEKFNGWANRATWNVALWLQNAYPSDLEEITRSMSGIGTAEKFRSFCTALFAEQLPENYVTVTPDGYRLDEADWDELWTSLVAGPRKGGVE